MRPRPLLVTILSVLAGVTLVGAAPLAATPATPPGGPDLATPDLTPARPPGSPASVSTGGPTPARPLSSPASESAGGPTPARPPDSPASESTGDPRAGPVFTWPLDPPHSVLRPFEAPGDPYGPGHRGVDLGGTPGQPVRAAASGTVVFAGQVAGRGVISIDHASGLRTTYEPVTPEVAAGQQVAAGEVLGQLMPGHPGCTAAACLHWGVRRGAEYLDPLGLLSTGRVRLLPWED